MKDQNQVPKSFRRQVADLIKANQLDPNDFIPRSSDFYYKVVYKDSGLFYGFRMSSNNYEYYSAESTQFNPSRSLLKDTTSVHSVDALTRFDKWIKKTVVKYNQELEIDDPWDEISRRKDNLKNINLLFSDDAKFTSSEVADLSNRLKQYEVKLIENLKASNIDLNTDQLSQIKRAVDYLVSESKKQSIFNWWSIAFNIVWGSIPLILNLDHSQTAVVYQLFLETLKVYPMIDDTLKNVN